MFSYMGGPQGLFTISSYNKKCGRGRRGATNRRLVLTCLGTKIPCLHMYSFYLCVSNSKRVFLETCFVSKSIYSKYFQHFSMMFFYFSEYYSMWSYFFIFKLVKFSSINKERRFLCSCLFQNSEHWLLFWHKKIWLDTYTIITTSYFIKKILIFPDKFIQQGEIVINSRMNFLRGSKHL